MLEFPREKYGNVWASACYVRKTLIWSLSGGPGEDSAEGLIVLLRDLNTEVLGRNSLPDLNPTGALALSICASPELSMVATMFRHFSVVSITGCSTRTP